MSNKDAIPSSLVETVAGFSAGVFSTLSLHPLDLIKTRLQVNRTQTTRFGSSLNVIGHIYRSEGGIAAFYRGLTPNVIGNSTSWGIYFYLYSTFKETLKGSRSDTLDASEYFIASGSAGVLTALLTNPIWVIKTRMLSTGSSVPGAYPSFISGARQIINTEGFVGFYRGLLPSLFGVSHGAFQFMAYEKLKAYRSGRINNPKPCTTSDAKGTLTRDLSNSDLLVISTLSKIFAGGITYPYQVLRTRLQAYDAGQAYRSIGDAISQILQQEGLRGFYKGIVPNIARVLPSTWITFLVYENTKTLLPFVASAPSRK